MLYLKLLVVPFKASTNSLMTYVHRPVLDNVIVLSQKVFLGILLLFFVSNILCSLHYIQSEVMVVFLPRLIYHSLQVKIRLLALHLKVT